MKWLPSSPRSGVSFTPAAPCCSSDPDAPPLGSIVVHALPDDYGNLPFISSRNPYVELLLPADRSRREGLTGRDVEFAVYGWSRSPLYSDAAARVAASR